MALNKSVIVKLAKLLEHAKTCLYGGRQSKQDYDMMAEALGAEMGDPDLSRRQVATTWADYTCCDDGKLYRFRVIVELEPTVSWEDPFYVSHKCIAELMESTGQTWMDRIEEQEQEQDEDDDE